MAEDVQSLSYIKINKHSSAPLYEQLYICIKEAIRRGILRPGQKLPTEEEVCRRFQVSRPVIRQAYNELVREGVIDRERGRGSFVKERENRGHEIFRLCNFNQEAEEVGGTPFVKVLSVRKLPFGDPIVAERMGIPKEEPLLKISRLRYINMQPDSYIDNYISLTRFPKLEDVDFNSASLYQSLEDLYGVMAIKANREIRAELVPDEVANWLNVEWYSPAIVIESAVYDQFDRPLEFSWECFPGNSRRFHLTVYREK